MTAAGEGGPARRPRPPGRHAAPAGEGVAPEPGAGTAVADLHAHTRRSDGVLEPLELARQARAAGVRLLAIADHDSLAAFRELRAPDAGLPPGLALVPAVEINAVTAGADLLGGEVHVLGLGVDPDDDAFEALLAAQRGRRRERFLATLDRLDALGLPVRDQLADLDLARDDALGRPTVARALVAAGRVPDVETAFRELLNGGRPAYVPRRGLGPLEAVRAIRAAGGLASLAHYAEAPARPDVLRELVAAGLDGLETHHRSFDAATREAMREVARAHGLVETGGTDYHGDLGPYAASHATLVLPDAVAAAARAAIPADRIHSA